MKVVERVNTDVTKFENNNIVFISLSHFCKLHDSEQRCVKDKLQKTPLSNYMYGDDYLKVINLFYD